jgi:hypothetical protein
MVVAESDHFTTPEEPAQSGESLADAVERRMEATPEHYGDEAENEEPVGSVHAMPDAEYQSEVQRIAKERGYDL